MNKCPVCGSVLKETSAISGPMGLEEQILECLNCKQYGEEYLYGGTRITIGVFETGFGYDSSREQIDEVSKWVKLLARIIKEEIK